jgi:hypothetical protein
MSDYSRLTTILKSIGGYSNAEIKTIASTAEGVELERIQASRGNLTELKTPLQCAAESPKNARLLREVATMIRHMSAQRYSLPMDKPVDLDAISQAIRGADVVSRCAVKSKLHELGLVGR